MDRADPRMKRVLGLDPGTRHFGWGVIDYVGTRLVHVAHGVIDTDASRPLAERLICIDDALNGVITTYAPAVSVVEALFFAKDPQAAAKLGHARGVALLRLARAGLPIFELPPARIKRAVVGGGLASKEQVCRVITSVLRLAEAPREDAADALAGAFAHITMAPYLDLMPPSASKPRSRRGSKGSNSVLQALLARRAAPKA